MVWPGLNLAPSAIAWLTNSALSGHLAVVGVCDGGCVGASVVAVGVAVVGTAVLVSVMVGVRVAEGVSAPERVSSAPTVWAADV